MERVRELGIVYNGATSHNYVVYYYTLPSDKLEEGLSFAYHAMTGILFDKKELEKERTVVLDEYNRRYSDPVSSFYTDMGRLFYEELFYRDNIIGPKHNILKADRKILLEQYNKFYGPANCNLIISGEFEFEKAEKLVKKIFEKWEKKVEYKKPEKIPPLRTKKFYHTYSKEIKTARILVQFRGPGTLYERKDTYIGDLVSKIFSLPYSPFQKKFVESGIAINATFSYYTKPSTGEISIMMELPKENIEKAKDLIFEFIDKPDDDEWFPDQIIEDAKKGIENDFLLSTENPRKFALELSFWICSADYEYFKNYVDEIKKLKKEDIKEFMKNYIKGQNFVFGILEPEK